MKQETQGTFIYTLQHGFFQLADEEIYEGYYNPNDLWNGFGKVHLPLSEAIRMADITNAHENDDIRYHWQGNILVCTQKNYDNEVTYITPKIIRADDTMDTVTVYEYGDIGYQWSVAINPWHFGLKDIKTSEDIERWLKCCALHFGCTFTQEDDFNDYMDGYIDAANQLNMLMFHCRQLVGWDAMYEITSRVNDQYQAACCERDLREEAPAQLGDNATRIRLLAQHIIDMADDSYLSGHPEWKALVDEARAVGSGVKPHVGVIVRGGLVEEVITNLPGLNVVTIDFDGDSSEDPILINDVTPTVTDDPLSKSVPMYSSYNWARLDADEREEAIKDFERLGY